MMAAVALAACGSAEQEPEISADELAAYEVALTEVATAVDAYETAAVTMTNAGECERATAEYAARVDPPMTRLTTRAGVMDGAFNDGTRADVGCVAARLRARYEAHVGEGCGVGDAAEARSRIAAHCAELRELANHLRMRSGELQRSSGDGLGLGAGWTDERGHTYGWDHEVPGCTPPGPGAGGECAGDCDGTGPGPGPAPGECSGGECDGDGVQDRDRDRGGAYEGEDQSQRRNGSGAT
jgi:hypothetical protein